MTMTTAAMITSTTTSTASRLRICRPDTKQTTSSSPRSSSGPVCRFDLNFNTVIVLALLSGALGCHECDLSKGRATSRSTMMSTLSPASERPLPDIGVMGRGDVFAKFTLDAASAVQ